MRKTTAVLFALAIGAAAQAQIVTSDVVLAGKTGDVELRRIAYRSDDLVVNGSMALPKSGTKLPCVIHNRGGRGGPRPLRVCGPDDAGVARPLRARPQAWPSLEPHGD